MLLVWPQRGYYRLAFENLLVEDEGSTKQALLPVEKEPKGAQFEDMDTTQVAYQ